MDSLLPRSHRPAGCHLGRADRRQHFGPSSGIGRLILVQLRHARHRSSEPFRVPKMPNQYRSRSLSCSFAQNSSTSTLIGRPA